MIKQSIQIAELISKYITGVITSEEEAHLNNWREESQSNETLFQKLCDPKNLQAYLESSSAFDREEGWHRFVQKKQFVEKKNRLLKVSRYAAAILLPMMVGVWLFTTLSPDEETVAEQLIKNPVQILPGEKKALLTLGSGEKVDLINPQEKLMEEKDGTTILIDSAALNYQAIQTPPKVEEIYNTIEVPHGGEYSLTLSDGTKIFLNSMSTLHFPVRFIGNKRVVELTGEAYFEVAKASQPFIVKANNTEVEVLGTSFNISAYRGETQHTTLVSGSVAVNLGTGEACTLTPSEQAYIKPGSDNINVRTVNVYQYTSWVNGKIFFKDERLEDIMNNLSRWYNIQVFYLEPSVKDLRFGCNVNRYKSINPFLELLEKTEKVDITIKGNTISFKHK